MEKDGDFRGNSQKVRDLTVSTFVFIFPKTCCFVFAKVSVDLRLFNVFDNLLLSKTSILLYPHSPARTSYCCDHRLVAQKVRSRHNSETRVAVRQGAQETEQAVQQVLAAKKWEDLSGFNSVRENWNCLRMSFNNISSSLCSRWSVNSIRVRYALNDGPCLKITKILLRTCEHLHASFCWRTQQYGVTASPIYGSYRKKEQNKSVKQIRPKIFPEKKVFFF